jgi:hypothetical protein
MMWAQNDIDFNTFNIDKNNLIPSLIIPCHDIRGSKFGLVAVVYGLFGFSSPPSPDTALCRVEKTKCDKYSDRGGTESRRPPAA